MTETEGASAPPEESPPARPRRSGGRALFVAGAAILGIVLFAIPRHQQRTMTLIGAAAGTYSLLRYDRNYFYWFDGHGARGVDTSFLVMYYSHEWGADAMRDEARRIAPALWPFADSAHLTKLWLKPTRGFPANWLPVVRVSYDVKFALDTSGTWNEVARW